MLSFFIVYFQHEYLYLADHVLLWIKSNLQQIVASNYLMHLKFNLKTLFTMSAAACKGVTMILWGCVPPDTEKIMPPPPGFILHNLKGLSR